nr:hypothetical protein [Tanacetum cinerariifolium]
EYCGIRFGEEQATTTTRKLTNQFSVLENNTEWSAQNGTTPTFGLEEDRHKMEDSFVGTAFEDQQKKEDKNTGTSTVEDFDLDKDIGKYLMTGKEEYEEENTNMKIRRTRLKQLGRNCWTLIA